MSLSFSYVSRLRIGAGMILVTVAVPVFAQQYYRSNAGGMNLGQIAARERAASEYVLAIEIDSGVTKQSLFRNGEEISRIERIEVSDRVVESKYRGGSLVGETEFLGKQPVLERTFGDGELERETTYEYEDQRLTRADSYDGHGRLLESVRYDRTEGGRVFRSVHDSEGMRTTTLYRFADEGLYEAWLGTSDAGTLYRYGNGALQGFERWEGSLLVRDMSVSAVDSGSVWRTEDFETGLVEVEVFDQESRLVESYSERAGQRIRTERFNYDDALLIERTTITLGMNERVLFAYDENGVRQSEEMFRNSELIKRTIHTGENEGFEELFRDGEVVLRVYFEGGRTVSEEPL